MVAGPSLTLCHDAQFREGALSTTVTTRSPARRDRSASRRKRLRSKTRSLDQRVLEDGTVNVRVITPAQAERPRGRPVVEPYRCRSSARRVAHPNGRSSRTRAFDGNRDHLAGLAHRVVGSAERKTDLVVEDSHNRRLPRPQERSTRGIGEGHLERLVRLASRRSESSRRALLSPPSRTRRRMPPRNRTALPSRLSRSPCPAVRAPCGPR
jgi:hypothetical protein